MAAPVFHSIWNKLNSIYLFSNLPQWDIPFCKNEWKSWGALRKVIPYLRMNKWWWYGNVSLLFIALCILLNTVTFVILFNLYSQAVAVENTMYLSGQIGIDPATSKLVEGIEAQTTQVIIMWFPTITGQSLLFSSSLSSNLPSFSNVSVQNKVFFFSFF